MLLSSPRTASLDAALTGDWWRPFTQVDDVAIVYVDLMPNAAHEKTAWTWLDDSERLRRQRFLHEGARRHYTLCRATLRSLLCDALDCGNEELTFASNAHGKPFAMVNGNSTFCGFNVSHSAGHGLIALACRGRVGIDVEEVVSHRNLGVLIEATLGPNEQTELAELDGERKLEFFFALWTIKEALGKAHGWGLSLDVSRFEVPKNLREGEMHGRFELPDLSDVSGIGSTVWHIANIGTDRFAAAVVHEGN